MLIRPNKEIDLWLVMQMASQYPNYFGMYKNEVISHALCHPDRRKTGHGHERAKVRERLAD